MFRRGAECEGRRLARTLQEKTQTLVDPAGSFEIGTFETATFENKGTPHSRTMNSSSLGMLTSQPLLTPQPPRIHSTPNASPHPTRQPLTRRIPHPPGGRHSQSSCMLECSRSRNGFSLEFSKRWRMRRDWGSESGALETGALEGGALESATLARARSAGGTKRQG